MRLPDIDIPLTAAIVGEDPLSRGGLQALLTASLPPLHVAELLHPDDLDRADLRTVEVLLWDLGVHPTASSSSSVPFPAALPTVVLAVRAEDAWDALREGALGALARDASPGRIWSGLLAAVEGLAVVEPRWLLSSAPAPTMEAGPSSSSSVSLSPREQEVLSLLAEGLSNRDIGLALHISAHTAKFHVNAILTRLGAATRTEAVVAAVRLGLLSL